jgi:hypothetical protein
LSSATDNRLSETDADRPEPGIGLRRHEAGDERNGGERDETIKQWQLEGDEHGRSSGEPTGSRNPRRE